MVFGVEGGDTETPKKAYHLAPEREIIQGLFIGQTYIDVTLLTDRMPTGDEKHVASAYAVSFGGNAVTAAFCCARLATACYERSRKWPYLTTARKRSCPRPPASLRYFQRGGGGRGSLSIFST